jgi:hypothetical protein
VRRLGLLLLVALTAGCDTEQPLQLAGQDGVLQFEANGASIPRYLTWFVVEDSDNDNVGDDVNADGVPGDRSLWCERDPLNTGSPSSVPWTYTVKVSRLRAGAIEWEILTSDEAAIDDISRAPYDANVTAHADDNSDIVLTHDQGRCSTNGQIVCNPSSTHSACATYGAGVCQTAHACSVEVNGGVKQSCDPANTGTTCSRQGAGTCTIDNFCSADPRIACSPTCAELGLGECTLPKVTRIFKFLQTNPDTRRILSGASAEVLSSSGNFIDDACRGAACSVSATDPPLGLCPTPYLGDPVLDPVGNGGLTSLAFELNKGDTLRVEARRSAEVPGGNTVIPFSTPAGLRAVVTIDGVPLQADEVTGNLTGSPSDPSPNLSFFFKSE